MSPGSVALSVSFGYSGDAVSRFSGRQLCPNLGGQVAPATALTVRGRGRPSEEIDGMKTIGFSRMNAPADSHMCCWPSCNAHSDDYPLCQRHQLKVYARVHEDVALLRDGLRAIPSKPEDRVPSIYFVRYRDRVKIGYSIDPMTRIKAHPFDEVLAIVPGDRDDEKRAHAAFAHLRENGEWFRAEDDLMEFARSIA